ncbi:MAG: hypothetical protein ACE5EX_06035 [Phycisphaerae bacterium]
MRRNSLKFATLAVVAGTMLQLGGCGVNGLFQQALIGAARAVGSATLSPFITNAISGILPAAM